jgi:hypothetical protein
MLTSKFILYAMRCAKFSMRDTAYFTLIGGLAFSLYVLDRGGELVRQMAPYTGDAKPGFVLFALYGWLASILAMNAVVVLVTDFVVRMLWWPTKWLAVTSSKILKVAKPETSTQEVSHVG